MIMIIIMVMVMVLVIIIIMMIIITINLACTELFLKTLLNILHSCRVFTEETQLFAACTVHYGYVQIFRALSGGMTLLGLWLFFINL